MRFICWPHAEITGGGAGVNSNTVTSANEWFAAIPVFCYNITSMIMCSHRFTFDDMFSRIRSVFINR